MSLQASTRIEDWKRSAHSTAHTARAPLGASGRGGKNSTGAAGLSLYLGVPVGYFKGQRTEQHFLAVNLSVAAETSYKSSPTRKQ